MGLGRPTSREEKARRGGKVDVRRGGRRVTWVCRYTGFGILKVSPLFIFFSFFVLSFPFFLLLFRQILYGRKKSNRLSILEHRRVTHAGTGLGENRPAGIVG